MRASFHGILRPRKERYAETAGGWKGEWKGGGGDTGLDSMGLALSLPSSCPDISVVLAVFQPASWEWFEENATRRCLFIYL